MIPTPDHVRRSLTEILLGAGEALQAGHDPLTDRINALEEARAKKDIKGWLKAAMPKIFHLPFCPLHDYQIETRHEPEIYIEAPRYHAKTSVGCVGIPLYQALEEPERFDYNLNVQSSGRKALMLNRGIKMELEQNEVLRAVYGDQVDLDNWTNAMFVTRKGVVFQAASMGQSLKGTNYRSRRPNYVLLDDAYDDKDITNLESTRKKNDWVESTLVNMMANDRPSCFHWTGTAVNDADGLKRGKEKAEKQGSSAKYRHFSAFGAVGADGVWRDDGSCLWPELRDHQAWKAKQDEPGRNMTIFNREVLNLRGSDRESKVQSAWLADWEYDPNSLTFGVDHYLLSIILSCDPSIGKKAENDPTGFAAVLKTQRSDGSKPRYWIDAIRNERMGLQDRLDHLKNWFDSYRSRFPMAGSIEIRVEGVSGFQDFGDLVGAHLNANVTIITRVPDKLAHLESKSFLFQNQRVKINKFISDLDKQTAKNQITTNYPENDDVRDCIIQALDVND